MNSFTGKRVMAVSKVAPDTFRVWKELGQPERSICEVGDWGTIVEYPFRGSVLMALVDWGSPLNHNQCIMNPAEYRELPEIVHSQQDYIAYWNRYILADEPTVYRLTMQDYPGMTHYRCFVERQDLHLGVEIWRMAYEANSPIEIQTDNPPQETVQQFFEWSWRAFWVDKHLYSQ